MRAGNVVRIRVNPKDSLSVLDVIDQGKINRTGMSYSQCVSLALASALETFRQHKIIPDRTGEEYLEMMQPFQYNRYKSQGQKLEITKAIQGLGSEIVAPVIEEPEAAPMSSQQMHSRKPVQQPPALPDVDPIEFKDMTNEFNALNTKRDNKHADGISWSETDEARWKELYAKIFGF